MTNHMQHTEANCGRISNDAVPPKSPVVTQTLQETIPEKSYELVMCDGEILYVNVGPAK